MVDLADGLYMLPAPPRPVCMYLFGPAVGTGSTIE